MRECGARIGPEPAFGIYGHCILRQLAGALYKRRGRASHGAQPLQNCDLSQFAPLYQLTGVRCLHPEVGQHYWFVCAKTLLPFKSQYSSE